MAKTFYDEGDIPQFQKEVCMNTCVNKGSCVDEMQDNHWFLMCPHYHSWKLGYTSFVREQLIYLREHPEEAEENRKKNIELAKKIKTNKKKSAEK